ncbi:MAG: twin-arginine translocation signal domain-containing protein [Nocardioides sp.]|nr:twin-arginine translocation signal domain-containing protein [Nocardioides sp.]
MSETSRRKLLAATGAGVAAGTVGLTMGPARASQARPTASSARESVVAYVPDHKSPTLSLMVGEREVVVHDRDLVTRILNAAGGE